MSRRYEKYKSATTVKEFYEKEGTPADLDHDIGKGFIEVIQPTPAVARASLTGRSGRGRDLPPPVGRPTRRRACARSSRPNARRLRAGRRKPESGVASLQLSGRIGRAAPCHNTGAR